MRIATTLLGVVLFAFVQNGSALADTGGVPNAHACRGVTISALSGWFNWRKAVIDGAVPLTGTTKTQGDPNLLVRTGCAAGLSPEVVSIVILSDAGDETMASQFLQTQFGLTAADAATYISTADGVIAGGGLLP